MVPLGAYFGAIFVIVIAPHLGKRKCIFIANGILSVGSALSLVPNIPTICVGRFLYGIGAMGMMSALVPKTIEETAPTRLKGSFGTMSQCCLNIGVLTCYSLFYIQPDTKEELAEGNQWQIVFMVPILIATIQSFVLLFVMPYDSLKFLKDKSKTD
jgi:MFS family permease